MSETAESNKPAAKTWRKWLIRLAAALVVVLVLSLSVLVIGSEMGKAAVRRQCAKLRAAGEPTTLDEYEARLPKLADGENAALIIVSLIDKVEALAAAAGGREALPYFRSGATPDWNEPWSTEQIEQAGAFLEGQADVLSRVDAIAELPRGRLPRELVANPFDPPLDLLATSRRAAKLEALAAMHDAFKGHPDGALLHCRTMLHIGGALADGPSLACGLTSMVVDALGVATVERVMASGTPRTDTLQRVEETLRDRFKRPAVAQSLRGEILCQLHHLDYIADLGKRLAHARPTSGTGWKSRATTRALKGWFGFGQAKSVELIRSLVQTLDDCPAALTRAGAITAEVQGLSALYTITKISIPSLQRSVTLAARTAAMLESARTALAAERYRLARGAWPENLAALVPEYIDTVPLDPFDGDPLRYRIEPDRIVIYSVHENRTDDGGDLESRPEGGGLTLDVGFRLLNPELRGFKVEPTPQR